MKLTPKQIKILMLMMLVIGILSAVQPAKASQPNCGPRHAILAQLATKHGEIRTSLGLTPNNQLFEMFANRESGTWTVALTSANGVMCLMANGTMYDTKPIKSLEKGDPA